MLDRIYLNPLPQIEGATWIELSQGYYSLVDTEVALIVPKFYFHRNRNRDVFYAMRNVKIDDKRTAQYLHRFVLEHYGIYAPNEIDHINRNGLDNRKDNLRPVTQTQNMCNTGLRKDNTSNYRGVYWYKRDEKWQAQITINKKKVHLGYFDDKVLAARAYDKASIKHYGIERAYTNFPKSDYILGIDY